MLTKSKKLLQKKIFRWKKIPFEVFWGYLERKANHTVSLLEMVCRIFSKHAFFLITLYQFSSKTSKT